MNDGRFDKAFQIIADRSIYETKQRLYYLLIHDGLRRLNKPFPTAADLHFPMIDTQITNLKPFVVAQIFGGERLCDFVAMRQQLDDMTEAAADYFTFEMRHRTSYRFAMETAVFYMLLRGRGVIKAVVDPFDGYRIKFKAIDPLYILMPQQFDDFTDMDGTGGSDYWVEIEKVTVPQYKRNRNYNQESDVLNAIRGRQDYAVGNQAASYDKQLREGITHSSREDEIILWNHWEKTSGGWTIYTYSPMSKDKVIRKPFGCPYKTDGKPSCPFFSMPRELKDSGWYAPRGVAELNAAFEAYATKTWNNRSDAMTFGNTPMFTSGTEIQNSANIRLLPGEYIPGDLKAVQMPPPAISFSEEINFTRELAEQRVKTPDFGITQDEKADPRTATENNRIAGLQDVGMDHNGQVLRDVVLQKLYRHVWGLMVQFQRTKLTYFVSDNLKELPQQALHDEYLVIPDGGAGTKQQRLTRAIARKQLFNGQPNINQDELDKGVLAADDSRLINKMLIPSDQKQASEAYQEDVELGVLEKGRPVPVLPGQDHATRIMECLGYLHQRSALGKPVDPIAVQRIHEHIGQHFQYLKKTQPEAAKEIEKQIQAMEQASATPSGPEANGQPTAPPNGVGMPGGGAPSQGGEQPKSPSESISIKLADLYPSERAQALKLFGITGAPPQEIAAVEKGRAELKAINVQAKPKIEGVMQ